MIIGHAAGVAAALAAQKGVAVQSVPVDELQKILLAEGAVFEQGVDIQLRALARIVSVSSGLAKRALTTPTSRPSSRSRFAASTHSPNREPKATKVPSTPQSKISERPGSTGATALAHRAQGRPLRPSPPRSARPCARRIRTSRWRAFAPTTRFSPRRSRHGASTRCWWGCSRSPLMCGDPSGAPGRIRTCAHGSGGRCSIP